MSWPMTQPVAPSAADDDLGEGGPEGAGDAGVELVGDRAAHVVGLDDVGEGMGGGRSGGAAVTAGEPT